jgi:hypothetical protein
MNDKDKHYYLKKKKETDNLRFTVRQYSAGKEESARLLSASYGLLAKSLGYSGLMPILQVRMLQNVWCKDENLILNNLSSLL